MAKKKTSRKPAWGKLIAFAVVLAALAAAWRWTPLAEIVTADNILAWSRAVRDTWWAPFAMVAAFTIGSFVLFPRPILTLVAVVTFGTVKGIGLATIGIVIAATLTYLLGRQMSRERVRRIAGDAIDEAAKPVRRHGVIAVFAANMLPTPPFVVQNIIAGALRIPLWEFLTGTALSLLPGIVAWTIFGDQITSALEDGGKVSPTIIVVTIVALVAFGFFVRRWAQRYGSSG